MMQSPQFFLHLFPFFLIFFFFWPFLFFATPTNSPPPNTVLGKSCCDSNWDGTTLRALSKSTKPRKPPTATLTAVKRWNCPQSQTQGHVSRSFPHLLKCQPASTQGVICLQVFPDAYHLNRASNPDQSDTFSLWRIVCVTDKWGSRKKYILKHHRKGIRYQGCWEESKKCVRYLCFKKALIIN